MIDITTVTPNNIPPEVTTLERENFQLMEQNEGLMEYSKLINILISAIVIGGAIAFSLKIKEQKKKVKNRN